MYAQVLEGDNWLGEKMDLEKVDKMSGTQFNLLIKISTHSFLDQQLGQMYELMQAIRKQELEDSAAEHGDDSKPAL